MKAYELDFTRQEGGKTRRMTEGWKETDDSAASDRLNQRIVEMEILRESHMLCYFDFPVSLSCAEEGGNVTVLWHNSKNAEIEISSDDRVVSQDSSLGVRTPFPQIEY